MKAFTRSIGKQFFPTEQIIQQHSFTSDDIETFSHITYAMFNYGSFAVGWTYPHNLELINNEVIEIILCARNTITENKKQQHPDFKNMYTLYLSGSIESIESNSLSQTFKLAELYHKQINNDIRIENYNEELMQLDTESLLDEIRDKAYSLNLFSDTVLSDIAELNDNEEHADYFNHAMKVNLLIENFTQLKTALTRKQDAAEIIDMRNMNIEENKNITAEIEQLKPNVKAA